MLLRFAAICLAATAVIVDGQITEDDSYVELIDETAIVSLVVNRINNDDQHNKDLEFEGYNIKGIR